MHGDVTMALRSMFPIIGHVQIASVPDRNEPDTGELDYAAAAPYAVLLIVISLPLTVLLRYGASQVAGR